MAQRKELKYLDRQKKQGPVEEESKQKYICYRCGREFTTLKGNFPVSHSHMYRGFGYLPWCINCVDQMYEYYLKLFDGDQRESIRRICMKMDIYFNEKTFNLVAKTAGQRSWMRTYIAKVNTYNNIDRTFDDTLIDEENARKDAEAAEKEKEEAKTEEEQTEVSSPPMPEAQKEPEIEVPEEVIKFWGPGHEPNVYLDLEDRMADWKSKYPEDYEFDGAEIALLKQICNLEVTITRDMAAGKSIEKSVNAINTVLGSLNIKPVQKKDDLNDEILNMPLGVGIQKWESQRPLPKVPEEMVDVNDIVRTVHTWFFGHTCKMLGIKNSYCKMYEDAMAKFKVEKPEFQDEDDDTIITEIFGKDEDD